MGTRVTFWNVQQGDCTLIQGTRSGWTALVDGGYGTEMRRRYAELAGRTTSVDLLVGTHYDADHLRGLKVFVDRFPGRIGHVLLPPILHPTGGVGWSSDGSPDGDAFTSHWLGDHIAAIGLEALRPLEQVIGDHTEEIVGAAREVPASNRFRSLAREVSQEAGAEYEGPIGLSNTDLPSARMLRSASVRLSRAGLPGLSRLAELAADLGSAGQLRQIVDVARLNPDPESAEVLLALTVVTAAQNGVTAVHLDALIQSMRRKRIPFVTTAAADDARRRSGPIGIWHLAPSAPFVEWHRQRLPTAVYRLFELRNADTALSTPSNLLSHVLFFEAEDCPSVEGRICDPGVLITGDSNFALADQHRPDSMSGGWESVAIASSIVDLPHHGGEWGRFASRISSELVHSYRRLVLYVGTRKEGRGHPPGANLETFAEGVCSIRPRIDLFLSNRLQPGVLPDVDRRLAGRPAIAPTHLDFEIVCSVPEAQGTAWADGLYATYEAVTR